MVEFLKVCGISNSEDAQLCADAGVDAIGMLLRKQPGEAPADTDRISVRTAQTLVASYGPRLTTVLLVHKTELKEISELYSNIRPKALQIQSKVPPEELLALKALFPEVFLIKTFHVSDGQTIQGFMNEIDEYTGCASVDAVLLDSRRGGSGQVHDWRLSAEVVQRLKGMNVILAGGLTPANVSMAVRSVHPWGIDVMTGVNSASRSKKDAEKIRAFVRAARGEAE
jgi:phosphoribosylanthranilate isomerase